MTVKIGLLSRRQFVAAAAVGGLAAGMGRAAPQELAEVDRLSALFLIDGAVSSFAEPIGRADLRVERGARGQAEVERRLLAEWGLSLLIETRRGAETRRVLLDFGYSPEVLLNNAALLGADLSGVDALMLSHGHYDHFGGLKGLLAAGKLRPGLPLYVGGEEALCHRLRRPTAPRLDFGEIDRAALRAAAIDLRLVPDPVAVAGHGFSTGRIPLSIERPTTPSWMQPGQNCDRGALDADKGGVDLIQDDSRHELGLAYNVKGKGLVVFGSCSHRGILNTIARAKTVSRIDRVHAVIGGFHLVRPQTQADAAQTATAMAAMKPDYVVPGHCSGEWFVEAAEAAMPGRIVRPYVGTRIVLGDLA